MGKLVSILVVLAAAIVPVTVFGGPESQQGQSTALTPAASEIESAISKVKPALVRLHVVWTEYSDGREIKHEAYGSGTIIDPQGHIVTNHHVAGRAKQIFVTLADKEEVEAELVGTDPLTDISVVKLSGKGAPYPFAKFGDSDRLRVGDPVLAMGSPMALSQSVTKGIVSNTELIQPKIFGPFKFKLEGEDVGSVVRWIGHDAPIYGGNSGGPLVNLKGEIVGINEIGIGLSGAIPGNIAREVAGELIKTGKVPRAWLGLEVQPLLKGQKKGILVSGVLEGSPADKAGFRTGDILARIAGKEVTSRFDEEIPLFNQMIMSLKAGRQIDAVVLRDGKEKVLQINPVEREEIKPKPVELSEWGVTARNISFVIAKELNRSNSDGVLITSIRQGGPCSDAKPSIREKDVITGINGQPVKKLSDLEKITASILNKNTDPSKAGDGVNVLVAYERGDEKMLTMVKVGAKKESKPALEVRKAWLPFQFQVLTQDLAEGIGLKGMKGVRVTQVFPVAEASDSGIRVGDVLAKLNSEEIPVSQPEDQDVLPAIIRQFKIGSKVEFDGFRDGKPIKVALVLPPSPKFAKELKSYRDENFEFEARDISFMDRVQEHIPEGTVGVMVESVTQGGWAAIGELDDGDLLMKIDGQEVLNVNNLKEIMKKYEKTRPAITTFLVRRGIHNLFLEMKPAWK